MNETSDTKGQSDAPTVSIAGGSLLIIGIMLWFFTSGTKTEVQTLQKELQEVKQSLEKQTTALQQLTARIDELRTPGRENGPK